MTKKILRSPWLQTLIVLMLWLHADCCYGISILRDDETEILLKELIRPLFAAAGLNPDRAEIYIINDESANAFTAGGHAIFVYLGLLKLSHNPDLFVGVMAHEIGHVVLGHAARINDKIDDAFDPIKTISLGILSGAAALATGNLALLSMVMGATQHDYLHYTRIQEGAADTMAVQIMRKSHIKLDGLAEAMTHFKQHEKIIGTDTTSAYNRTHPMPGDRLMYLRSEMQKSDNSGSWAGTAEQRQRFAIAVNKLRAYTEPIASLRSTFADKTSPGERYAMAIVHLRANELSEAKSIASDLARQYPTNPHILELRAHINYALGDMRQALSDIAAADKILGSALTGIKLSHIAWEISAGMSPEALYKTTAYLRHEATITPYNPELLYTLANAYSAQSQHGMSHATLAMLYAIIHNPKQAQKHSKIAKQLSNGTPEVTELLRSVEKALTPTKFSAS